MWYKTNYDQFSDSEEQRVAERWEKRQKLKSEENKIKDSEMQDRLSELNGQFLKIKESKKENVWQCFVNKLY